MDETEVLVKVTEAGKLELPDEIRAQFQAGEEYLVSVTNGEIHIKKVLTPEVDLDEFFRQLNEAPADPNQPSLQEISEVVKEVRWELWKKE
ncbi:hypothetical protein OsccyDRAFT_0311 [Leptolyngbyaceae cyanobacterium JSC-12]|nr:hypothetical protein OsccyDRAFT_0311 [Leptolyngbyaceae cyanobacterium JSC-12]